jgi:hypothetical protein
VPDGSEANGIGPADTGLSFALIDSGVPLYQAQPPATAGQPALYYALIGSPASFPKTLDPTTAWEQNSGAFLFLPGDGHIQPASPGPANAVKALNALVQAVPFGQWVVWAADPSPASIAAASVLPIAKAQGGGEGRVASSATLPFANMVLQIGAAIRVQSAFGAVPPGLSILPNNPPDSSIVFQCLSNGNPPVMLDGGLTIPFAGPSIGTWSFSIAPNRGQFYGAFAQDIEQPPSGAELRYFYTGATPGMLRYPLMLGAYPVSSGGPPQDPLPLVVTIDPLRPFSTARTRFAFDLSKYDGVNIVLPVCDSLRTTAGATVMLTPQPGAGFGLAMRPPSPEISGWGYESYLTPAGPYALSLPPRAGALEFTHPIANNALEVMCAMFGTEFLLVAAEDILDFEGEMSATAGSFSPPANVVAGAPVGGASLDDPPLGPTFTTNWVQLIPGPNSGTTFPYGIKQGYCAQAADSVYYQTAASPGYKLPIAVGVRLADLSDVSANQIFPMASYGLTYFFDPNNPNGPVANPNPGVGADTLSAFEAQILSVARREAIALDLCLGPLLFDMATLNAMEGGYVRTPRGLLVQLNDGTVPPGGKQPASLYPPGTWAKLLLACSPLNPQEILYFGQDTAPSGCTGGEGGPYCVVSPYLSAALLAPAPFIVMGQTQWLGPFANRLTLGEFPAEIDITGVVTDAKTGDPCLGCVLIFKLAAGRSVKDLASDPASWTDATHFSGPKAAQMSQLIGALIADAERPPPAGAYNYFETFVKRVSDPSWTGILALNAPIPSQSLPADVQMLLCGMTQMPAGSPTPLVWHHFGINVNASQKAETVEQALHSSALFGLVHYDAAFATPAVPLDFQTLSLNCLFENSVVVHFNSQIAFSTTQIFGDPAALTTSPPGDFPQTNTIVIDGKLQKQADTTRIVFTTSDTRIFTLPTTGSQYRVLAGHIVAQAGLAPVRSSSSGQNENLVAAFTLNGALNFSTRADSSGTPIDLFSYGSQTDGLPYTGYGFELDSTIPPTGSCYPATISLNLANFLLGKPPKARDQSLMATLPLQIKGFNSAVDPNLQSVPVSGSGIDGATPKYAIELQLVMGTLGALTSKAPLDGTLYLGWTPGGDKGTPDKSGLLLVPPEPMANGTFKLQGVLPTQYGDVELLRPKLAGKYVYVLMLDDVRFTLGGFALFLDSTGDRSLTFFGKPASGTSGGVNLAWFLGEPDLSSSVSSTALARPAARFGSTNSNLTYTPLVKVVAGIKVKYDMQASSVISSALDKLGSIPLSTTTTLDAILSGATTYPVTYDPSAGVTVGISIDFPPVSFQGLFSDPYIYGAVLAIAAPGKDDKPSIFKSIGGFSLEIAYRKISDDLGAWSASFTLQSPVKTENYEIQIPTIGLVIYTNTDWRVDIGWPFSPASNSPQPFMIQAQAGPLPLRGSAGLYLAKLRGADVPATFSNFGLIWRFGLGLSIGIAKKDKKGPFSYNAGLIAFLTFEGFLASTKGSLSTTQSNGFDYFWFAGQLGVQGYVTGKADFKIISASISITLTLVLQIAYETAHTTTVALVFSVTIKVKVKIIFVSISFSFDATITIGELDIGSGPKALITGPTPIPAPPPPPPPSPMLRGASSPMLATPPDPQVARRFLTGESQAPIDVTLYFLLHPAVVNPTADGIGAPQAVAGLVVQSGTTTANNFTAFADGVAYWLLQAYGGSGTLAEQLSAMAAALDAGTFEGQIQACLSSTFRFTILPAGNVSAEDSFVFFPMLPQLALTYGGAATPFDSPALPEDYASALTTYFNQLAPPLPPDPAAEARLLAAGPGVWPQSAAGLVASDLLVLMGKQLVAELQNAANKGAASFDDALATLRADGFANLGGFLSRFALYGLRLPVPGVAPFGSALTGIYQLTGQQIPLVQDKGAWVTIFQLGLAADQSAATWIQIGTDGKPVSQDLGQKLVLTTTLGEGWLGSGSGLAALPAIAEHPTLFYQTQVFQWADGSTAGSTILPMSDVLSARLASAFAGGAAQVTATMAQTDGATSTPLASAPALMIRLGLRRILPSEGGPPLAAVYRLIGTDDLTRGLLEELIQAGTGGVTSLSLLLESGSGSAFTSLSGSMVLAKANLSTLNEPPAFAAFLGRAVETEPPSSATLTDVADFLTLVWEVSVVHAEGFYLHVPNLPDSAFANGDAQIALVAELGAAAASAVLPSWSNSFVIAGALDRSNGAAVATVSDNQNGTWSNADPARDAGLVGFVVNWQSPPQEVALSANPSDSDKALYAQGLYTLLQHRVSSVSPALSGGAQLPSNWSRPVGPNQDSQTPGPWTFSSSISVQALTGAANRYAGIGANISFTIQMLDLYGNALPQTWSTTAPFVYNDRLLPTGQWQAVRTHHAFSAGDGDVLLTLLLDFDPARLTATDPASIDHLVASYQLVLDQLTDPSQASNPNAGIQIVTTLAAQPLSITSSGSSLRSVLAGFVQAILAQLAGPSGQWAKVQTIADFGLDRTYPAKLPSDLTELSTSLVFFRDPATVDPTILAAMPAVQSVTMDVPAAVALDSETLANAGDDGPDTLLTAFAKAFEQAWYGYDGRTAQLKLAQGLGGLAAGNGNAPRSANAHAQLWCIRLGAGTGIEAVFPNTGNQPPPSDQPIYYSPRPLSTKLISRDGLTLLEYGGETTTQVVVNFRNIDLDTWGRQLVSAVETMFGPDMATALAVLDSDSYGILTGQKQKLAGQLTAFLAEVLGEATPDSGATGRFTQALLQSLSYFYSLASVVSVPATVTIAGQDEPAAPPQLYGKLRDTGGDESIDAYSLSPARLEVASGTQLLHYLVAARNPEAQATLDLQLEYDVAYLEHDFQPAEELYGYEPSSWLSFIIPWFAPGTGGGAPALNYPIGPNIVPIPLRAFPQPPAITLQTASTATPATLADALNWSYDFNIAVDEIAQDEVNIVLLLNDPPTQTLRKGVRAMAFEGERPPPADLFEALARVAYEYPQIAADLATLPAAAFAGGDPAKALTAAERLIGLVIGVTGTIGQWHNPGNPGAVSAWVGARTALLDATDSPITTAQYCYKLDLSDTSNLSVTRSINGSTDLPPWPAIEGYAAPASTTGTGVYVGAWPTSGPLAFSLPNLFMISLQSAHVKANVVRNANLGTHVNNDFIYTTDYVELMDPALPLQEADGVLTAGAGAPSLAAAVDALFAPFAAGPVMPGVTATSMRLSVNASYLYTLAQGDQGGQQLTATIPIFLADNDVALSAGGSGETLAAYKATMVAALGQWQASVLPSTVGAALNFAVTLYAEISDKPVPLARLSKVQIPVPAAQPGWWPGS